MGSLCAFCLVTNLKAPGDLCRPAYSILIAVRDLWLVEQAHFSRAPGYKTFQARML